MATKLYVGNLSYSLTNDTLKEIFEVCGDVEEANVIRDRDTGRSKGFGFVTIGETTAPQYFIDVLNGKEFDGRPLTVSLARERSDNQPRLKTMTIGRGNCVFCGEERTIHGFDNQPDHVGACDRCIKALNYYVRNRQ